MKKKCRSLKLPPRSLIVKALDMIKNRTNKYIDKITQRKIKRKLLLNLVRELKKDLWNMTVTVIPTVIGALGTIPKTLIKVPEDGEIRENEETIQTTTILRWSEY